VSQPQRNFMRRPDAANPGRAGAGGVNRWSELELRELERGFAALCAQLPGRNRLAVARRLLKQEQGEV
jgi:hypothetical protein